jgi:hypothetical protein
MGPFHRNTDKGVEEQYDDDDALDIEEIERPNLDNNKQVAKSFPYQTKHKSSWEADHRQQQALQVSMRDQLAKRSFDKTIEKTIQAVPALVQKVDGVSITVTDRNKVEVLALNVCFLCREKIGTALHYSQLSVIPVI